MTQPSTTYRAGAAAGRMVRYGLIGLAVVIAAIVIGLKLLPSPADSGPPLVGAGGPSDLDRCVERGKAHFASIGSEFRLSDGRLASDVAKERCRSTLTAF